VLPDLAHPVEVAGLEGVVEGLVGGEDGVTVVDAANITPVHIRVRTIRVRSDDGSELAAYDFGGTGQPLLLGHATGFHAHMWLPVVRQLHDGFRCYAWDARGHGASGTPASGDFDWRRSGDDARAVAGAFGLERPLGAGHSAGASALVLAEADHPGSVGAMWLFEPVVPDWSSVTDGNPLVAGARRRRDHFASREEARERLATKPPFDLFTAEALDLYVEFGFVPAAGGGVTLACRRDDEAATYEGAVTANPRSRLAEVDVAPHVATGNGRGEARPPGMDEAVALLPRGRLEVLGGLSHFGPFEDPVAVAASIRRALG
jgi:pimeloyl-ACP methyl ester carboxylesterase